MEVGIEAINLYRLKKNSSTQMVIKKIDFDIVIPEETFSERRLMKKELSSLRSQLE